MVLPSVSRLCAALLLVLLPAAAAQQQEAAGECQQYTNRSCEECLKNVTAVMHASSLAADAPSDRSSVIVNRQLFTGQTRRMNELPGSGNAGECARRRGLFKEENPYAKFEN
ncbi:hypothetical protein ASZ78_003625 [Callipepla squamata]|uniref:Uncharacterized protein n=1 Tax=Callipepla squamata TaxID=9009 RepID=A0A226MTR6_CALSU|nr:hypothetical protein ASZ78_003625 [Callipepla squamata]